MNIIKYFAPFIVLKLRLSTFLLKKYTVKESLLLDIAYIVLW